MDSKVLEIADDLKSYLEYLKGIGVESLPKATSTDPESPPQETLIQVRESMGDCKRCKLHGTRTTLVFGEGNEKAALMLIGEGPGYDEDIQGRPFVGKAGQLLTKILQSIHLERHEVYIANIVKCRPPQNRNPEPDEVEACLPFILRQVRAIRPKIICTLGSVATQTLLQTEGKITALRGRTFDFDGIQVIPTYHPAFLLRNPERKRDVWEDMKRIDRLLKELGASGHSEGTDNR